MASHTLLFVDVDKEIVILEDGTIPITTYLDEEGDECEKEDAVSFVCGDEARGYNVVHFNELKKRVLH